MELRIVGAHPLAKDERGRLQTRIGTLFPYTKTLITLPGIHATQRLAYLDLLDQERQQRGQSPLPPEERSAEWQNAVDLIMEDSLLLIRPDPDNMALAFQADEVLSDWLSARQVRFLHVTHEKVHEAIKQRGECWRITPLPKSATEMRQMIRSSRIGIEGREIYYYNNATGTRFLTCHEFARLGELDDQELRRHLLEIQQFATRTNRLGNPQVGFFLADRSFGRQDLATHDFTTPNAAAMRATFETLRDRFYGAVPMGLRRDDPDNTEWRNRMFAALIGQRDEVVSEETLLGLSSEYYMQIEWLPGGRFEEGELILDPIYEKPPPGQPRDPLCDEKVLGFIFNFIREYGDLAYINIGRVVESLSKRKAFRGRRDVYIAQIRPRGSKEDIVKILRMQKWGVREHLDENKPLLQAMLESEEYTDYVLDRRMGCRQLGMNLIPRVTAGKITETYTGKRWDCQGQTIWSPYFERDYIRGMATDKVPFHRLKNDAFAHRFARLLGAAAAPNLIVGRCHIEGPVVFDDGDEVILEDDRGLPQEIKVVDQLGTFTDFRNELPHFAPEYAEPIRNRLPYVSNPQEFVEAYLTAFCERFTHVQQEYRRRQRAFDNLFAHRRWDEGGSFAFRWAKVLQRLNSTDPRALTEALRGQIETK